MMMKIRYVLHLLSMLCLTVPATASSAKADTSRIIAGAGTRLCSDFVKEYAQAPQVTAWIYLSWAQGYLSAINLQRSTLGEMAADMIPSDLDLGKQVAFLKSYCLGLPERHFDQAARQMYLELLTHDTTVGSAPPRQ